MIIVPFREQRPSRDQLQLMLGKLQSRLDAVESSINFVNNIQSDSDSASIRQHLENLKNNLNGIKGDAKDNVKDYIRSMYQCMTDETGVGEQCKALKNSINSTLASLVDEANAFASLETFSYLIQANSGYINSLTSEANRLKNEISRINSLLGEASSYLGGLTEAAPLAIANLTDEYKDDQWLQFDFSSTSANTEQDDSHEYSKAYGGGGFHFFFFGGGSSSNSESEKKTHAYKLAKADIAVKGELLRVNIKRPWFKPQVFDDPGLNFVSSISTDCIIMNARMQLLMS